MSMMNTQIEVMKERDRKSAFYDKILSELAAFAKKMRKENPEWRKGQALSNCASCAFTEVPWQVAKNFEKDCFYEDAKIDSFLLELKNSLFYGEPQVGIFWFYYGLPIFVHAVPLSEGEHYGEAITGTKDHADYWEEYVMRTGWTSYLHIGDEYFSVPRGRVVYHSDTKTFTVYHGNNLSKADLKKVAAVFRLPREQTRFEKDIHYCDVSDEEWRKM